MLRPYENTGGAPLAPPPLAQKKRPCTIRTGTLRLERVVPPGIEPGTQGFSVLCSTN